MFHGEHVRSDRFDDGVIREAACSVQALVAVRAAFCTSAASFGLAGLSWSLTVAKSGFLVSPLAAYPLPGDASGAKPEPAGSASFACEPRRPAVGQRDATAGGWGTTRRRTGELGASTP